MAKRIPMRQCVGCGEMKMKKDMIRVLKTAEDPVCRNIDSQASVPGETACRPGVVLDKTGKKNGRGAYLCNSMDCLKKAIKNKGLERSLKIAIPAQVYEDLEREFEESEE